MKQAAQQYLAQQYLKHGARAYTGPIPVMGQSFTREFLLLTQRITKTK